MDTPQVVAILVTGVFAIAASGLGQYIGGRMAERRASQERNERETHRFTNDKRDLFLDALRHATFPPDDAADSNERLRIAVSLALFDADVAKCYLAATKSRSAFGAAAARLENDLVREVTAEIADGQLNSDLSAVEERALTLARERLSIEVLQDRRLWVNSLGDLGSAMRKSLGMSGAFHFDLDLPGEDGDIMATSDR